MDLPRPNFQALAAQTASHLRDVTQSQLLRDLSHLSLPEIESVIQLVAEVIPAGNVPGIILSGLARLPERQPPPQIVRRDIDLLFSGVEQVRDTAVYGAFFAGPAAILWGYQNLLKLVGKDVEAAFPQGAWQFYVEYALREDTARHANETHGFDTLLNRHQLRLSPVDRLTSWVMAAIHGLHQYDAWLENEWRERVFLTLLRLVTRAEPEAARYASLYRRWEEQRPYGRDETAAQQTYALYRRHRFDRFLETATRDLSPALRADWQAHLREAEAQALPAYQRQMSLLAYLEPGTYGETRVPLALSQAHIGVIYKGRYFLIPICAPGSQRPTGVAAVRAQVAALLADTEGLAAHLTHLAEMKRGAFAQWRQKAPAALITELDQLRTAPILINADQRPRALPLPELRRGERGVGDQGLTLFDTGETMVFDQSHIFFDGGWGAALAEILTQEALSWAVHLNTLPPVRVRVHPRRLNFKFKESDWESIRRSPRATPEASAESVAINLPAILALRKLFKRRSDLLQLTVNDLLILYRAIHAATYQLNPELVTALQSLARENATRPAALAARQALQDSQRANPAILIPVDACQCSPRDRLYPMTFEVPLQELDLLQLHTRTAQALLAYRNARGNRAALYAEFDQLQRTYLATLAGFGAVMNKAKTIATSGESPSVGTLKLLAHLPPPLQRFLDDVPSRFDILNDLIKGREVFSNVGAVAATSTLTRFITAKDDNDKKTLAWGAITDASGVLHLTLRDFRPHVGVLQAAGHSALATQLAQDYLNAYTYGLNLFVRDLRRITLASRETRLSKSESTDGTDETDFLPHPRPLS